MKIHYINILLFELPLNILIYNQRNHKSTTHHTLKIPTTRLLCECELYSPANYDNDPEMKEVMEIFDRQTSERFHEYDERMVEKRMQCKDKCDKEIQKIILKDKLEKELAEKFVTLQTDIQNDAIPTCVCEKSIADKVEKGCLRCVGVFGGGVMPGFGTIGGTALYALNQLKPAVFKAAIKAALEEGAAEILAAGIEAGDAAGMNVVRYGLRYLHVHELFPVIFDSFVKTRPYNEITSIANSILLKYGPTCTGLDNNSPPAACTKFQLNLGIHKKIGAMIDTHGTPASTAIRQGLEGILEEATQTAEAAAKIAEKGVAAEITARETALIEAGFNSSITSINASIFAIVVIVLIMVIIYLILRYRRKKKMKKKLQYIKLLEE
ncbi:rifin [Plasmodium falciparum NF54]|uniref:Rifin n=2 Tax=Plasmodium falciparum TaxID=5833 RepID=Q8I216_PLAF7|nr:rifin [Plasmodium falciparum 3D7]KAF4330046.1 rifin [Plasmodium falciparum NF54]PKC48791.1 rifin [Plasmodium falciparum NF54]CAD49098.1 rifin [Plasmodium falciparum 3D7]|eukprot:XP_001351323.1 rifin [Plasmodium falciparum 3D7]